MRPLISQTLAKLPKYVPGKSIESVKRELGLTEIIKLASNESPFGPSPKAVAAMRAAMEDNHRYPDDGRALRDALGLRFKVPGDQVILGSGATDLIELCVRTFCTTDGHAIFSNGSFVAYKLFLLANGIPFTETPLKKWDIDLDAMAAACTDNTQLVLLPNPNNPTGSVFSQRELDRFLAKVPDHVVVVLDDAYRDYNDAPDAPDSIAVIAKRPRTVVLQSFSKVYGLAGMRVGYGISSPELLAALVQVQRPFPVARLALDGALAAVADEEHYRKTVHGTWKGRVTLSKVLEQLGFVVLPTQANFVAIEFKTPAAASALVDRLLRKGFIIRALGPFGMPSHARISVGTEPEVTAVLAAVAAVLKEDPTLKDR